MGSLIRPKGHFVKKQKAGWRLIGNKNRQKASNAKRD
jgi:hypothetical protein